MDHKNILNFSEHKKLGENIILIPKLIMSSINFNLVIKILINKVFVLFSPYLAIIVSE